MKLSAGTDASRQKGRRVKNMKEANKCFIMAVPESEIL